MPKSIYHRAQHAAHYGYNHPGVGHDVESWDAIHAWKDPRPADIPADATRDLGYYENGEQHYVYRRIAPLTGTCKLCEDRAAVRNRTG